MRHRLLGCWRKKLITRPAYYTDLTDEKYRRIAPLIPPAFPGGRTRTVDTMGLILAVVVHAAGIQGRDGAKWVWERLKDRFARLELIWADGGYRGKWVVRTKKT